MNFSPPQSGKPSTHHEKRELPAIAGGVPVRSREDRIIFGAPLLGEPEAIAVADCIRSGWIGLGERVGRFEQEFAAYKNAPHAAAVSSCSAGLHLVLLALGIGPGDEVIAPSLTFCSTIHAILHVGATPMLVDSDLISRNIAPDAIERAITPRTKAIIVVHMDGRCCEMDAILALADRHRLKIVEDCAHAIETTYRGRAAGLLGDAGCFSFYPTKSITTGDGGMVISRHQSLIEEVKLLSYNGVATSAWKRFTGNAAGYEVRAAGYKYNMTDIGNRHAYHLYAPMLSSLELSVGRDQVVAAMEAENIGVGIHYQPVHTQPFFTERFGSNTKLPTATYIGQHTISLPLSASMSEHDVDDVCVALARILNYYAA